MQYPFEATKKIKLEPFALGSKDPEKDDLAKSGENSNEINKEPKIMLAETESECCTEVKQSS